MVFVRFLNWIIHKLGIKALLAIGLLLMSIGSVGYGMADTVRGLDTSLLMRFIFLSIIISWLLAKTKIWGWLAAIITTILGILFIFMDVGNLLPPLIALSRAAYYAGWASLNPIPDAFFDPTSLNLTYAEVYYSIAELLNPLWNWLQALINQKKFFDEIAVMLFWGMILWGLSAWAGWMLRRNNKPLVSVLPAGVVLVVSLSYTGGRIDALVSLLFSTLLLMGLNTFSLVENRWESLGMDFPEDLPKELTVATVGVVVGLVMISVLIPSISIRKIVDFVRQYTQPQMEEVEPVFQSFGLEQQASQGAGRALWAGMPRYHTFQSSPEFLERVVMSVQITSGVINSPKNDLNLPLYWRSLTYDQYTGMGWLSSDVDTWTYNAGQEAIAADSSYHSTIQQDVRLTSGRTNYLYAAGMVLSADDEFKISWRHLPESAKRINTPRDFFGGTIAGASYRVQSIVPIVNEADLQSVSGDYPEWILERYLPLPENVSNRVIDLAFELTAEDQTAYEKARSLEEYLRGFEYNLDLEEPPEDREMVAYFIFDLKEGYCDYYATSMAVMARSIGLPARLAIGYYRGEYDTTNNRYIVTEADAHSWPEIYFPEIGWIPFEPTAGRAGLELPTQDQAIAAGLEEIQPLDESSSLSLKIDWQMIWVLILGGSFLGVISIPFVDAWRIKRMLPFTAVEHLYNRLYSHGRSLNVPARKGQTPFEFASNLQDRVSSLFQDSFWQKIIGQSALEIQAITEIQEFTHAYVLMLYSPLKITIDDREEIYAYWRYLRRRLWLARFRQWTSRKHRYLGANDGRD